MKFRVWGEILAQQTHIECNVYVMSKFCPRSNCIDTVWIVKIDHILLKSSYSELTGEVWKGQLPLHDQLGVGATAV